MLSNTNLNRASRLEKASLAAGVAVPVLYFLSVFVSALFFPGYSHVTQYASELGSAQARYPAVFNSGIALTGVATIAAGLGFFLAGTALAGGRVWNGLAGISLALFGIALCLGAFFPMPDPRHGAFGLGAAIHLTPFFLAASLRRERALRPLNWFLLSVGVVMLILFAVSMGIGSLVTRGNVGVVQRTYAFAVFAWMAVAAVQLLRRRRSASASSAGGVQSAS